MKDKQHPLFEARRGFLGKAASAVAAAAAVSTGSANAVTAALSDHQSAINSDSEPFWGTHQGGIATTQQQHIYFAAFDLTTHKRDDVITLMRHWTDAASRMAIGLPGVPLNDDISAIPADSGSAIGLPARRLTLTFGFGSGLFIKDGVDRYGLAVHRPEALIDLPRFNGDQLVPERTGGDLCVQICADDPQVALHAIRELNRQAEDIAKLRWTQTGFVPGYRPGETGRNLMGFKDGTMNVPVNDAAAMSQHIWVGDEGGWMKNGSYLVTRPIRIALEHWDRMKLGFQEQVVGRHKHSGAPLGGKHEKEPLNLDAVDVDGNPVVPENSHARLAAPASNDGSQILRRGYAYDNGVSFVAERWPPWRQGMEFDAGLLFVCFQRDPRTGFVRVFEKLSKFDMMNQFTTHIGGGLFACPAGVRKGEFIGESLFKLG